MLEIWREGSGRRDAVYYQPSRVAMGNVTTLIEDAIVFAGMAALEGSRLEDAGARDEARDWYRAILRSSRLIGRHGVLSRRLQGARIHALAARLILRWAADPRVGAGPLRRALDDTLTADALTPPVSEAVKIDYLSCLRSVENMRNFESMMLDFGRPLPLSGGRQTGPLDQLVPWRCVRLPVQRFRLRRRPTSWSGVGACSDCCSPTGWRKWTGRRGVGLRWRSEDRPGFMPTTRRPPPRPAP